MIAAAVMAAVFRRAARATLNIHTCFTSMTCLHQDVCVCKGEKGEAD